jgi:hypothetical protein
MVEGSASAASIFIDDLLDGAPAVTTNLALKLVATTFEQAIVTGNITAANQPLGFSAPGTHSVILLEPSSDPFGPRRSDFLTLTIGEVQTDPAGLKFQPVTAFFQSDGANGFLANLNQLPTDTPRLLEDGTKQDVSQLLNSSPFQVTLQSDLTSSEPVPEPAALALAGLGALGLLGYAGLRRWRAGS